MCIWEKRNKSIKDPEPLKFCRRFERFAASLVRCLSEASCARKTSESATVQNGVHKFPGLDLLYSYFVFLIYTNGYSNHYECVWGTVLAVNFGICRRMIWEISKLLFFNFSKHLDKSVLISFFDLPFTNTKIISQYRLTYTLCSGLNSVPLHETVIR